MKTYGGIDVQIHVLLTSALIADEKSVSRSGRFTLEKETGTYLIGGWVGRRTGLNNVERSKILLLEELELRPLGRPARSQSLNRLNCPGSSSSW
jgi:hypothetical protein